VVVVIMGVSGVGKTTVGRALAATLGWEFHDADALHAPEAISQMARGEPLTDAQRQPWLALVRATIADALADGRDIVVACSALRESYREMLGARDSRVRFVFLDADPALIRDRLATRDGHFSGTALLASQLATLQPPIGVLTLDAALSVDQLVSAIRVSLP
jgi:gluconokinase